MEESTTEGNGGITFRELFAKDIDRSINGVIKASDEKNIAEEVDEYVLTNEVRHNLAQFLDVYNDPMNHMQNGAWISGFFGSGKSHLLKMLSHILGQVPAQLVDRTGDEHVPSREDIVRTFIAKADEQEDGLLAGALERSLSIPATSVLFNIDEKTDSSYQDQSLLYAFVRVFNETRGYFGKLPAVAKFEENLDANGWYGAFKDAFARIAGKSWQEGREEAFLWNDEIGEAFKAATGKDAPENLADAYDKSLVITPDDFAEDVNKWLQRQGDRLRIVFFVDEVGQFVGNDPKLMLSLQTVTESLATHTQGRAWVVVTSQEDIDTVVGDRSKQQGNDFSKIQGRFQVKIKLSSTDAVEVIQKRLLVKKPEYATQMEALWNEQNANLRTMFEFSDGSSQFATDKAYDADDFKADYPFVNYEFPLFQEALRQMSQYNMFSGNYSSVGARSMLAAVSDTLKEMDDKTIGTLVPFDSLYDGIASAVQSTVSYRIHDAARSQDDDIKDMGVRLLKALLLVRHVDGFKATPHNLRILLTDRFDMNVANLDAAIKRALDALERETYVRREGEVYQYLTNEEQEIEQEIKRVEPDGAQETLMLKDAIVNNVLGGRLTMEYGKQGAPFRYCLKINGIQQGMDAPVYLDVITPSGERDVQDARTKSMGGKNTIYLVLGFSDPSFTADLRQCVKTETYLRHTPGQMSAVKTHIIAEKREANEQLKKELRNRVAALCAAGTFYYNGNVVPVKATGAKEHAMEGLQYLVGHYYTNFAMLGDWRLPKDSQSGAGFAATLGEQIAEAARTQTLEGLEGAGTRAACAEEVLSAITRMAGQTGKPTTNVKSLLDRFFDPPYGWPSYMTLLCIGYLYGKGRVELVLDDKPVQRTEAAKTLTDSKRQQSIEVRIPRTFDSKKVGRLRTFAQDFLGLSSASLPSAPLDLAQAVKTKLAAMADDCQKEQTKCAAFAFASQLDEPIALMRNAAAKPEAWLIEEFTEPQPLPGDPQRVEQSAADRLLDLQDDVIDPIVTFSRSNQRTQMEQGLHQLDEAKINLSLASAEVQTAYRQAESLAQGADAYRKVPQFKSAVSQMQTALDACVEQERTQACERVAAIRAKVRSSQEFAGAAPQAQQKVNGELDTREHAIEGSTAIATIREIASKVETDDYSAIMSELLAARLNTRSMPQAQPSSVPRHAAFDTQASGDGSVNEADGTDGAGAPTDTDGGDASHPAEAESGAGTGPSNTSGAPSKPEFVTISSIARPHFDRTVLVNENDVSEYLEAYCQELLKVIHNGGRILL